MVQSNSSLLAPQALPSFTHMNFSAICVLQREVNFVFDWIYHMTVAKAFSDRKNQIFAVLSLITLCCIAIWVIVPRQDRMSKITSERPLNPFVLQCIDEYAGMQ